MLATRLTMSAIGLVSTSILARLLMPDDFGVLALAMSIIAGLEAMGAIGVQFALIRNQDADRTHYDTAWTLNVIKAAITAALLAAIALPVSIYLREPRIVDVLLVIAILALVQGFENIGVVDFVKHLNFRREFRLLLISRVLSTLVALAAALFFRDYWALVIGIATQRVARLLLGYVLHPYRPRFSLAAWRELLSFSAWMWVISIAVFANERGPLLISGRHLSTEGAGMFSIGNEMGSLPSSEILQPAMRALFPGLSKLNKDSAAFVEMFSNAFVTLLAIHTPLCLGIALVSELFVRIVFGEKWLDMAPFMSLIAYATLMYLPSEIVGISLVSAGRASIDTYLRVGSAVIRLPLLYAGVVTGGLVGAGWALVAAMAIELCFTVTVAQRTIRWSPLSLLRNGWRILPAAAAMVGVVTFLNATFDVDTSEIVAAVGKLFVLVLAGASTYLCALFGLWAITGLKDGPEAYVLSFLRLKGRMQAKA